MVFNTSHRVLHRGTPGDFSTFFDKIGCDHGYIMIVTETKKHRKQDAVFGEKVGKIFNLVAGKTFRSIFDLKNLLKSSKER